MERIAIYNNKGGVGKTTLTVNIAACLGKKKYQTLVIDTDPQANTSTLLLGYNENKPKLKLEECLGHISEAIVPVCTKINSKIKKTTIDLISIEKNSGKLSFPINYIDDVLDEIGDEKYDYVLMDTNPAITDFSLAALYAADYILVPINADRYSIDGWGEVVKIVEDIRKKGNPNLKILGAVINRYVGKGALTDSLVNTCADVMGDLLFDALIKQSLLVDTSGLLSIPVPYYRGKSSCTIDFNDVTDELIYRIRETKKGGR